MKYILRTLVVALGGLLAIGQAKANQSLWASTARIIKVSDLRPANDGTSLPPSRTGVLIGNKENNEPGSFVYTVTRKGEKVVDSESPYLVIFPVTNGHSSTKGVIACRGIYSGSSDSNRLMALMVPGGSSMPPVLMTDPLKEPVQTGKDATMITYAYDTPAHEADKDTENIKKINTYLQNLWSQVKGGRVCHSGVDSASLNTAFLSYMNVFEQTNKVSSSRAQTTDHDRFYVQSMEIREHMVGAPVFINGLLVGMSESEENVKGLCKYISARGIAADAVSRRIVLKFSESPAPAVDTSTKTQTTDATQLTKQDAPVTSTTPKATEGVVKDSQAPANNMVFGLLAGAAVLLVVLVVVLLVYKKKTPPPSVVMTLQCEDGKRISVTSKMVRKGAVLGRSSSADIKLSASCVSGRHAHFCAVGSRAAIQDDGSTNGTFVNGERLQPNSPKTLHPGDTIKLGTYEVKVL